VFEGVELIKLLVIKGRCSSCMKTVASHILIGVY
jgi:hypothetical protein